MFKKEGMDKNLSSKCKRKVSISKLIILSILLFSFTLTANPLVFADEPIKNPSIIRQKELKNFVEFLSDTPSQLESARLIIKPINEEDAQGMYDCLGDSDTAYLTEERQLESIDEASQYIEIYQKVREMGFGIGFSIFNKDTKEFLGFIAITDMNFPNNIPNFVKLNIGGAIIKEHRNHGYMTEAVKCLSDYIFDNYYVSRMEWKFFEENTGSKRVAEKAGFQYEGTLRNQVIWYGKLINMVMYSRIK